ncbi:hypothetical protein [Marisediminicola sp. LYQ134]|uniref:hypothetical protein n=1 Tax=unclassified Marisediminicola TaxID=2618316 RepID=UPI003983B42D
MSDFQIAFIGVGIIIIIITLNVLKRVARRKTREYGVARKASVTPDLIKEFSTSVILDADADRVTALIEGIPKKRTIKTLRPGVWGINFAAKDDVVIEVRPTGTSCEVVVTSVTQYMGLPQGLPEWQRFVAQIEEAAKAEGLTVQRGSRPLTFDPADPNTFDNSKWLLAPVSPA